MEWLRLLFIQTAAILLAVLVLTFIINHKKGCGCGCGGQCGGGTPAPSAGGGAMPSATSLTDLLNGSNLIATN